jgi:hypothetical protein
MGVFGARTSLLVSAICVVTSVVVLCSQADIRRFERG